MQLEADDLTPITDASVLLGFSTMQSGDIVLSPIGKAFAEADIQTSKEIFRQQVLERVPLMKSILQTLRAKSGGSMQSDFFVDILYKYLPADAAKCQFQTMIDWGVMLNHLTMMTRTIC